jgi:Fe-Mn family superoxide dismutase
MDFTLPPLPYPVDALAPTMSAEALRCHHARIHGKYLERLQVELAGAPEAQWSVEQLVLGSYSHRFNLAAEVYNHAFFWASLRPGGGGPPPPGEVGDLIEQQFGSYEAFRAQWIEAGLQRFASGYVWLTLDSGRVEILPTPNAETPLATGAVPLLVTDVWEHAYYLDYRDHRDRYLEAVCDELLNWDFVALNLSRASDQADGA